MKISKSSSLLFLFALVVGIAHAQPQTSDTIHVKNYSIYLDTIRYSDSTIWGHTDMQVVAKMNGVTTISLTLLRLTVDSITSNNLMLVYSYNDTVIAIPTPGTMNLGDSIAIKIYYHGHPQEAMNGWGGFIFSGVWAFNIGANFYSNPHNDGKAWYPCVDEFGDKSLYDFYITTSATNKAACNGTLQSVVTNPDSTKTWHWHLAEPIPSYLACVTDAPFYTMHTTVAGYPVQWDCMTTDTNHVIGTFQHISNAIITDTTAWGPYRWEKIGYELTPFNGGGMEHATAINLGIGYVNGTLTYESLWVHELSHHWFGDLVTCKNAGDMWLNEGWAVYNESLFDQAVYGETSYRNWHRSNHRKVLQFAHIIDGSYLSLDHVPNAYTYGNTVYQKGADIARTMRNYMGDADFFPAVKGYLNDLAFGNADNYDFRDKLSQHSSINMARFFDDWVFHPGFPHFSIDSVRAVQNGGNYNLTVYTRQRNKGDSNHIYQMPVDITFADSTDSITASIVINNLLDSFQFTLPFNPTWTALDRDEKIAHAVSCYERPITTNGNFQFLETNAAVIPQNLGTGTNMVRIEHNFVHPDGFKGNNLGIVLSDYHYYTVDGIFSPNFLASCTFSYNGSGSTIIGYLDNTLITGVEDSLVLLYRSNTADDWHIVSDYTLNINLNHIDKVGSMTVDTLLRGEYAFGYRDVVRSGMLDIQKKSSSLLVFPNPNSGIVNISFHLDNTEQAVLKITDIKGKTIYSTTVKSGNDSLIYDASKEPAGSYFVSYEIKGKPVQTTKFILNHQK